MAYTVRSPKEKLRIVIEGMKAENISALCRQEGISPTDYYRYKENLINRFTPIVFMAYGKYWVNNHAHVIDSIDYWILRYLGTHINAIDLKPYEFVSEHLPRVHFAVALVTNAIAHLPSLCAATRSDSSKTVPDFWSTHL